MKSATRWVIEAVAVRCALIGCALAVGFVWAALINYLRGLS